MPRVNGFFEVDLDSVPTPELDPDWAWSKGYSREQMEQWVAELEEIQRLLDSGATADELRTMRTSADPKQRALGETYYEFYEHQGSGRNNINHVKLAWLGDHYDIDNGQHRIWLAKQRGLTSIPARVSAPDQPTLQELQARGTAARRRRPLWERRTDPGTDPDRSRRRR